MPSATALARLMTLMDSARYSVREVIELVRGGFDGTTIADISEEQAAELANHMERVHNTRSQADSDWIAAMRQAVAAKQRDCLDEGINASFDDEPDPIYLETDADRYRGKPERRPYNVHDNTIGFDADEDDRGPEEPFPEPDDLPPALQERGQISSAPAHWQDARTPAQPTQPVTAPPAKTHPPVRESDQARSSPVRSPVAPSVRPPLVRLPLRQVRSSAQPTAQASAVQPASQASPPRLAAGQSVRPAARAPSPSTLVVSPPSRPTIGSPKPSERTTALVAPATGQPAGTSVRPGGPPPGLMPRRSGFLPTTPVALADISPEALARATPDNPAIKTRIDLPPVFPSSRPTPVQQSSSAPADQTRTEEEPQRHIRRPKWLDQLRDEDPPD